MLDGTYILDGYEFGRPEHAVVILTGGLDPGAVASRTQDVDNPVGDGSLFGRDFLSGPTLSFTLGVRDDADVYTVLGRLAALWRDPDVRLAPGVTIPLRFARNGRTYRVYGRPRDFSLQPAEVADDGWQIVEATFKTEGPTYYVEQDDLGGSRVLELPLVASAGDGGLVLPEVLPWELRPSSQGRTGTVTVGGIVEAPFRVVISGPTAGTLSGIALSGPGWLIKTSATVAYDQTLTIDTRAQTITLSTGDGLAGTLSRKSRLSARLQPGAQTITFDGNDPTNTAVARVYWHDAMPL